MKKNLESKFGVHLRRGNNVGIMKHTGGSFEDLKAIVRGVGFVIEVAEQRGHAKQIRTVKGQS